LEPGLGLLGWLGAAVGLEALEFLECLDLGAASVVDAALETALIGGTVDKSLAGLVELFGVADVFDFVVDAEEAGEEPGVADDVVEQGALDGGFGLVVVVEGFGELGEGIGVIAGDDGGLGVDTRLESVHAGNGFALDGGWTGGLGRVAAVSFDLTLNCWLQLFNREEGGEVGSMRHTTLATARLRFLFVAAKIWRHAGRVGISYSDHYEDQGLFHRLMDRVGTIAPGGDGFLPVVKTAFT